MMNSVLEYLENSVGLYPDKIAIVDRDKSITFSELKKRAISIAKYIQLEFNCKKKPIFIYIPKGIDSIVCFMATLYSGNFYTPTDVDFPWKKVEGIIDQLKPSIYLTYGKYKDILIKNGIQAGQIVDINNIETSDSEFDYSDIIDTDLAYVLFTSGSTGIPKGVAIMQRSIIDYIDWAINCFSIDASNVLGNQAPFYFDNSTLDIYLMLATGATLHIIPKMHFAYPAKLMNYVKEYNIDTIFWVPSVIINIANYKILESIDCSCLKNILFAGEVMPNKQLNYWRDNLHDALYANLYGPTEITVDCTYYIVNRKFEDDDPLPIGKPCYNSDVLVLDENDQLIIEHNVTGELCVRGTCLAAGYWNNAGKTDEVFVQNPLNTCYPEKIYRTGDLVYYNEYDEMVFVGRKDLQIKHMGYRIELGEIETATVGCEGITNVCAAYNKKIKQIVLFYQGDISDIQLRDYLINMLPKYMVPTIYYKLKSFPYNDNGKIDRKKLENDYLI
ncbi:MAG: amino acid adenylation domain-containing protein [Lachnospiraceae bacterium]|nr:amino acid adenylation domain-containing protein [Lachnospiraceae bacterium]